MKIGSRYLVFLLFLSCFNLKSQNPCGFDEILESFMANNPNYDLFATSSNRENGNCSGSYEIPVVFHILHNNGPENISNDQIDKALKLTNDQFAGKEGGFDTKISFILASVDPNGNPTTGINRIQTSEPGIINYQDKVADANMKNLSRWPVDSYLNIWVVEYIGGGELAGYAYYPNATTPEVDGVVVDNEYLGNSGTAEGSYYNTLTHEIGHYFGLFHPWGCDFADNCPSTWLRCHVNSECETNGDFVCDTPPMAVVVGIDCGSPPVNTCHLDNPDFLDPLDNYMSYSPLCQFKFTEGQTERMCYFIHNYRASLLCPISIACNNNCDKIIVKNTLFDIPRKFGGNIYVKSGGTLTITSSVELGQGKSIFVENGGKLIIKGQDAILNKCSEAISWGGIKIENGGSIEVREGYIYNANKAIFANSGSIVDINKIVINGLNNYTGTGIWIEGDVEIALLKDLNISNVREGIFVWDGVNNTYRFQGGEIRNTLYAINVASNTARITDYYIDNTFVGILFQNSNFSSIDNSYIGYRGYGIIANWSPSLNVVSSTIGWSGQSGHVGLSLFQSDASTIRLSDIQAKNFGIINWNGGPSIYNNNIDVLGSNNQFGGGIQIKGGSLGYIGENYIYISQSSFGIETVEANSTYITQNQIDHFSSISTRTAAIRSMGGMDNTIEENIITGIANTTGIIAQNSTSNHYLCNITNNTYEGLGVYYNSEEQEIIGNQFDAGFDLVIKSAVGIQEHHGNKFFGGRARANELDNTEKANSVFKVNPEIPFLMPDDPLPNDGTWFKTEPNIYEDPCDGTFGPEWIPFDGDPGKICTYWIYLKSIRATKPEIFFIKLYHLIKYSKTIPGFNLPDCIKLDPVFQQICGLTKLVEVSIALNNIGKINTTITNIANLQAQYINESLELNRALINSQIENELTTSVLPAILFERRQDSISLDSLENELNTINCTQIIVNKWKEILKLYVKFLKKGYVEQNNMTALLSYSSDCSDLYGEVIHLARAMANTFDSTYFDIYDGCLQESPPRSSEIEKDKIEINIFPNPTLGKIYLQLPLNYNGYLRVFNAAGKEIIADQIVNSNIREVDLSHQLGVFYVQITSNEGDIMSKKIVVLK